LQIYQFLKKLEEQYHYPKVKLQCALKFLDKNNCKVNPCDAGVLSFGARWDGLFLTSPWALLKSGVILDDDFKLGYLHQNKLSILLATEKAQMWQTKANNNFGHCKIFANIAGDTFAKRDDLYAV
jgi:hypothetical protein